MINQKELVSEFEDDEVSVEEYEEEGKIITEIGDFSGAFRLKLSQDREEIKRQINTLKNLLSGKERAGKS